MSDPPSLVVIPGEPLIIEVLVDGAGGPAPGEISIVEVLVEGPQGPANTDYQIGGSMPTDPNIKIWYNTSGA